MFFVQDKMWSLLTSTYKYYPLFCILSILFIYIIVIYLNIINILDALTIIKLFFKGYNLYGEMYFYGEINILLNYYWNIFYFKYNNITFILIIIFC